MKKSIITRVAACTICAVMAAGMTTVWADESQSAEKTKLYVVNWKDYASDDEELMAAFEEEYNCEIVNTYMESEETLLTMLKTAGEGEIDVCLPNCTILTAAINEGLLKPIDTSRLSNFDQLYDRFKEQAECFGEDGQMYAVPFVWGSTAIAYNTDLLDEAPTTIAALFDEQYAGKIAFRDDYNDAVMTAALVLGMDPTDPDSLDLDAIEDLLIEQKSIVKAYWQTGDEFSKMFAGGQVELGLMWSGQTASMKAEGEPIAFTVPEDGALGWVDNWAIAAGSQHEDLAYAFIDYMISHDVQYAWSSSGGPAPANQTAADDIDPDYAASCGMDEESLNRLSFMVYLDDETKAEWSDLWIEVKAF